MSTTESKSNSRRTESESSEPDGGSGPVDTGVPIDEDYIIGDEADERVASGSIDRDRGLPDPGDDSSVSDPSTIGRSGEGSLSAQWDWARAESSPESNDGRSATQTTFYEVDADTSGPSQQHRDPHQRRSWTQLAGVNDGMYARDVSRASKNSESDSRRWVETFGSTLECTDHQVERTKHILTEIDMGPFMGARIPVEMVIVGILSIEIDAEITDFDLRATQRDGMDRLLSDLGAEQSDLMDVRKKLKTNESELL